LAGRCAGLHAPPANPGIIIYGIIIKPSTALPTAQKSKITASRLRDVGSTLAAFRSSPIPDK
jgi:hypothetical protein